MRFAMMEAAALLHWLLSEQLTRQQNLLVFQLMQITEEVCTDPNINTTNFVVGDVVGPAVYLLKLIVRQYGFNCLKQASVECQWVIPQGLRTADQVYPLC